MMQEAVVANILISEQAFKQVSTQIFCILFQYSGYLIESAVTEMKCVWTIEVVFGKFEKSIIG